MSRRPGRSSRGLVAASAGVALADAALADAALADAALADAALAGASAVLYRQERRIPTKQKGPLTQNMNHQLRWVKMAPPTSGPRTGPSSAGIAPQVTSRPSDLPPAAWKISVVITGSIRPPPRPWTTTQPMSA